MSEWRLLLRYESISASRFLDAPNANSDRISKSSDTDGSPASIFATLD